MLQPMFKGGAAPSLRLSEEQKAQFSSLCEHLLQELGTAVDITPQPERTGDQSALTLRITGSSGCSRTLRLCVSGFIRWAALSTVSHAPIVIHAMDAADVMALAAERHRRLTRFVH